MGRLNVEQDSRNVLRCFSYDNPKTWYSLLPWAQFWYNSSFHHSIGMSLFKAVFGKDLPQLSDMRIIQKTQSQFKRLLERER